MLQDPENPSVEWQEIVKAKTLGSAQAKCEAIAARDVLVDVLNVTQATKTPDKNGDYKFICWFKGEVHL